MVTVTEDGSLESAVNIDIKCEVAGGTSILWIVDDGTEVKKGEKIIELDSAALEESINQQRIATEKARAAKIQAEKDYAAAKLAVEEYLARHVRASRCRTRTLRSRLRKRICGPRRTRWSIPSGCFAKATSARLDLESQKFQVQRAKLELDSAQTPRTCWSSSPS